MYEALRPDGVLDCVKKHRLDCASTEAEEMTLIPDLEVDPQGWFAYYDENKDGYLEITDVAVAVADAIHKAGEVKDPHVVVKFRNAISHLWVMYDHNSDGKVDMQEFLKPKVGLAATFTVQTRMIHGLLSGISVLEEEEDVEEQVSQGTSSNNSMGFLTFLTKLELERYANKLVDEGFDTVKSLKTLTKEDLEEMGFKTGHRRGEFECVLYYYSFYSLDASQTNPSVYSTLKCCYQLEGIGSDY